MLNLLSFYLAVSQLPAYAKASNAISGVTELHYSSNHFFPESVKRECDAFQAAVMRTTWGGGWKGDDDCQSKSQNR